MLFDLLKPRLPLLVYSLGISLTITLIRGLRNDETIKLTLLIFSTLSLLSKYAPEVLKHTKHGLGLGIGGRMVGGDGTRDSDVDAAA